MDHNCIGDGQPAESAISLLGWVGFYAVAAVSLLLVWAGIVCLLGPVLGTVAWAVWLVLVLYIWVSIYVGAR
jgi:hypothetical protein